MKEPKYKRRDRKYKKKRYGMKIDGKSLFNILRIQYKRNKDNKGETK